MHGKVWLFSHLIDDEDLAFLQREFISYQQAMEYYGLRYKPVVRIWSMGIRTNRMKRWKLSCLP